MSSDKGFTLMEIITALVIVGILAVITVPSFTTYINQGAANAAQHNLIAIYNAENTYYFSNNSYCTATTGTVANCGNTLANLNSNLATLNQASPAITTLNINDTNFNYSCTSTGGFQCTATNVTDHNFYLILTNSPIILPGAASPPNPSCSDVDNSSYCSTA